MEGEKRYELSENDKVAIERQIQEYRTIIQGLLGRQNSPHPEADLEDISNYEARIRELQVTLGEREGS